MDSDSWLGLGILVLCLVFLAFMATAEAGLTSISKGRLKYLIGNGEARAKAIGRLLQQPGILLSTIAVAKIVAIVGFASLATALAVRLYAPYWGAVAATAIASLLVLAFFQIASKTLASRNPERTALLVANTIAVITLVLNPLVKLFSLVANLVFLPFGSKRAAPRDEIEEVCMLADIGDQEVVIEEEEKQMIRGVVGLEDTAVREIMVPRIDIVAIDTDTSISSAVEVIIQRGYSRIPLYEDTIDNIVGIIYAKDLLRILSNGTPLIPIKQLARPAHFIPESKKVDELLREFQQKRVHMAIVVDEYGGTAGLVTIEDLLEEIVGEIEDEYDIQEPQVERISQAEAIMDAKVSIHDLNEMFELNIEGEDFDTVGGFLFTKLGKIPTVGDELEANGVTISVLSTSGRRIKKVRVTKTPIERPENQKDNPRSRKF